MQVLQVVNTHGISGGEQMRYHWELWKMAWIFLDLQWAFVLINPVRVKNIESQKHTQDIEPTEHRSEPGPPWTRSEHLRQPAVGRSRLTQSLFHSQVPNVPCKAPNAILKAKSKGRCGCRGLSEPRLALKVTADRELRPPSAAGEDGTKSGWREGFQIQNSKNGFYWTCMLSHWLKNHRLNHGSWGLSTLAYIPENPPTEVPLRNWWEARVLPITVTVSAVCVRNCAAFENWFIFPWTWHSPT